LCWKAATASAEEDEEDRKGACELDNGSRSGVSLPHNSRILGDWEMEYLIFVAAKQEDSVVYHCTVFQNKKKKL